jgi:hypothetical protein
MEHRQECGFTPPKIDMDNRFMRFVASERGLLPSTTSSSSSNYRTWDNDTSNTTSSPHRTWDDTPNTTSSPHRTWDNTPSTHNTSNSPHRTWDDTPNDIRSRSNSMPLQRNRQTEEIHAVQKQLQPIKWDRNNSNSRLRSNTIATSSPLKSSNTNITTKNKEEFPALVSKSAPATPQAIQPKSITSHVPSLEYDTAVMTEESDKCITIDKKPIMTTFITFSKGKAIKHVFDITSPTSSQQLESISVKNIVHTPKKSPYSNWADMFKDKPRVPSVAEEGEGIEGCDGLEGYDLDRDWADVCTEEKLKLDA